MAEVGFFICMGVALAGAVVSLIAHFAKDSQIRELQEQVQEKKKAPIHNHHSCPDCGIEVSPKMKFCVRCGQDLI